MYVLKKQGASAWENEWDCRLGVGKITDVVLKRVYTVLM